MAFKMKGPSTHKGTQRHRNEQETFKLKLDRSMDKTSMPDGKAGSSPMQLNPSKIGGKQVSDQEADNEERKQNAMYDAMRNGKISHEKMEASRKGKKVTRTGGSEAKDIMNKRSEKERKSGKLDPVSRDMLANAKKVQADPKNYESEKKQVALNKAYRAKKTRKKTPVKSSPYKAGALAAAQGVEKGVKAVKGIKDTVDSMTGKTAMTDAMNAPVSATASGKEAKK